MSTHPLHVKTDRCVIPMLSLAFQSLLSHSCATYWFWWKQLANPNKQHVSEPFKLTEILAQHDPLAGQAQGLPELLTWQGVAVEGGGSCVRGMLLHEHQTSSSGTFHFIYALRFNDCHTLLGNIFSSCEFNSQPPEIKGYFTQKWKLCHHILTLPMSFQSFFPLWKKIFGGMSHWFLP